MVLTSQPSPITGDRCSRSSCWCREQTGVLWRLLHDIRSQGGKIIFTLFFVSDFLMAKRDLALDPGGLKGFEFLVVASHPSNQGFFTRKIHVRVSNLFWILYLIFRFLVIVQARMVYSKIGSMAIFITNYKLYAVKLSHSVYFSVPVMLLLLFILALDTAKNNSLTFPLEFITHKSSA